MDALDLIEKKIHDDLAAVRNHIKKFQSEQAAASVKHKVSEGEQRANETDALQGKALPFPPAPETEEEKQLLEPTLSRCSERKNRLSSAAYLTASRRCRGGLSHGPGVRRASRSLRRDGFCNQRLRAA